ncbi:unnamed protein product [Rotaria socialis]|uniref:Uncharacterized protein n=1 Tax=Rotaria socialis TaxID=392032 RepID=A0A819WZP0_9BILA|nr:unnamed protein product [Rotaria socialis]CAF3437501.1 unnamed protein product [Rotaria socialis]CAF3743161.1 unnamed protein product [Rotaria socialis]CAF4129391.1 unnamed protein product [Rotaria socialis]CAF4240078.1 unnamed protein product [Rotaria socialis]
MTIFLPRREQIAIVDEAIELLGGTATDIYSSKTRNINKNVQNVEIVTTSTVAGCFGSCRATHPLSANVSTPVESPMTIYHALECKHDMSYIVPVNSYIADFGHRFQSTTFPVMNFMLLRQLIITKTCRGNDRE